MQRRSYDNDDMSTTEWTVVRPRHQKRSENKISRGPRTDSLDEYLKNGLYNYGGGRFATIEDARNNLLLNMSGGLEPKDLSAYEVGLLQQKYGRGDLWYTKLGYE